MTTRSFRKVFRIGLLVTLAAALQTGCATVYYETLEKVGIAKREVLADRVEDTQEAQEEAKEQFTSALEQLLALTGDSGGDLKLHYDALSTELKRSEKRAEAVRSRISGVRSVAEALFNEWEKELDQYTSRPLRTRSKQQLHETRKRYDRLMLLMQRAADRMEPVLATLRDQVLFLKHNLNAQTVAGLDGTVRELETEVSSLIADMERSIAEADAFLKSWNAGG
jgi:gas vesicle protein